MSFVVHNEGQSISFSPANESEKIVTVGGKNYKVMGENQQNSRIIEKIKACPVKVFKDVAEFQAVLNRFDFSLGLIDEAHPVSDPRQKTNLTIDQLIGMFEQKTGQKVTPHQRTLIEKLLDPKEGNKVYEQTMQSLKFAKETIGPMITPEPLFDTVKNEIQDRIKKGLQ